MHCTSCVIIFFFFLNFFAHRSNLSLILLYLQEEGEVVDANTIASVLRCLCKAPRLPALDWGVVIRRCMQYDLNLTSEMQMPHAIQSLRIECLNLSLAHASNVGPFLHLVDELSDSSRFGRLELNLQTFLLQHVSNICKIFSSQRLEKLFSDLAEYFSSSSSSYLTYEPEKKKLLRVSFWNGLHQCLVEAPKEFIIISNAEKCMVCLFHLLPTLIYDGLSEEYIESKGEWSVATSCFSEAPKEWLVDMLQVFVLFSMFSIMSFCRRLLNIKFARSFQPNSRLLLGSYKELDFFIVDIYQRRLDQVHSY